MATDTRNSGFCEGPFNRTDEPAACARITMDLAGANGDAWMHGI